MLEWALDHTSEMNTMGKKARECILKNMSLQKTTECFFSMIDSLNAK